MEFTRPLVLLGILFFSIPLTACPGVEPVRREQLRIVDAHLHYWDTRRADYSGWPPPSNEAMYRPFLPAMYEPEARKVGIVQSVIVDSVSKPWVRKYAQNRPALYPAYVSRMDRVASEDFAEILDDLFADPRQVGFRIHGNPIATDYPQRPQVLKNLKLVAQRGGVIEILPFGCTIREVASLAESVPELKIMLNHLGLPGNYPLIAGKPDPDWVRDMEAIAKHPKVYLKMAGLAGSVKSAEDRAAPSNFKPYFDVLVRTIGTERLVYSSNWPVSLVEGVTLNTDIEIIFGHFQPMGRKVVDDIFANNARRFYGISEE